MWRTTNVERVARCLQLATCSVSIERFRRLEASFRSKVVDATIVVDRGSSQSALRRAAAGGLRPIAGESFAGYPAGIPLLLNSAASRPKFKRRGALEGLLWGPWCSRPLQILPRPTTAHATARGEGEGGHDCAGSRRKSDVSCYAAVIRMPGRM